MKKPYPGELWGIRIDNVDEYIMIIQSFEYRSGGFDILAIWNGKISNVNMLIIPLTMSPWFHCE